MQQHKKRKKWIRRIKKRLYFFLLALNSYDFKRLRPYLSVAAAMIVFGLFCLLPVTKTDNRGSNETALGESLAHAIRFTVAKDSTTADETVDVVALFLSTEALDSYAQDKARFRKNIDPEATALHSPMTHAKNTSLYSFYLTGKELYALAESAVAFPSSLKNTSLYLSGLSYSYHPFRLPLNRITALTLADGTPIARDHSRLYRVIGEDAVFPLFQYLANRSQGIMRIFPKNRSGVLLSAYEEALLTKEQLPLSLTSAIAYSSKNAERRVTSYSLEPSVVTKLGGLNPRVLFRSPNSITLYIAVLLVVFLSLLTYCIPQIRRVIIWIRIAAIHRRKRGRTIWSRKKDFPVYKSHLHK